MPCVASAPAVLGNSTAASGGSSVIAMALDAPYPDSRVSLHVAVVPPAEMVGCRAAVA